METETPSPPLPKVQNLTIESGVVASSLTDAMTEAHTLLADLDHAPFSMRAEESTVEKKKHQSLSVRAVLAQAPRWTEADKKVQNLTI